MMDQHRRAGGGIGRGGGDGVEERWHRDGATVTTSMAGHYTKRKRRKQRHPQQRRRCLPIILTAACCCLAVINESNARRRGGDSASTSVPAFGVVNGAAMDPVVVSRFASACFSAPPSLPPGMPTATTMRRWWRDGTTTLGRSRSFFPFGWNDNDAAAVVGVTSRRTSNVLLGATTSTSTTATNGASSTGTAKPQQPLSSRSTSSFSSSPSLSTSSFSTKHNGSAASSSSFHRHNTPANMGYDAESILRFYDRRPWEVGLRLNMLGLPLLGWYVGLIFDKILKRDDLIKTERRRGEQLRTHLVNSGSVALVKSGQALSLRPDLLRSPVWAEELGKLVDEVGSFPDLDAMNIIRNEFSDLLPKIKETQRQMKEKPNKKKQQGSSRVGVGRGRLERLRQMVESDPILSMFEFYNDCQVVASASIGQVYKARIRQGPVLEAAIGKAEALKWGGKTVAIKIQRPDVFASASLDMYLLRRTAMWLSKFRGGDVVAIADTLGTQLFGELDYEREANNCERFRVLYGDWGDVIVPPACVALTRKKVLVMKWIEGTKGPWKGPDGIDMVRIGLRCSTDQLLRTGLFHADPHRGNLLRTPKGQLAVIDFGMMSDIPEEDRYGLIGLVIGLKTRDLTLATENLLKLGFLEDTTQVDELVPRLRQALENATGGTNKASDLSFSQLQVELDAISRNNVLKFRIPPFITIIIRSLTILEGFALSVDPNFRLIRGAYPYVLKQLISPEGMGEVPRALNDLLARLLLKVDPESSVQEVNWGRLRDFLTLAEKASRSYDPSKATDDDKVSVSRKTIDLFLKFLTSKTGLFLKEPLVHEVAETIDAMASMGEANLLRMSGGLVRPLPGGNGPINTRRMEEMRAIVDVVQSALLVPDEEGGVGGSKERQRRERLELLGEAARELLVLLNSPNRREITAPILAELNSVFQMVAVEVLEIRSSRAIRGVLGIAS